MGAFDRLPQMFAPAPPDRPKVTAQDIQRVIGLYGAVLEQPGHIVRPIEALPVPKAALKLMLQMAIKGTTNPEMQQHLVAAYMALAEFQPLTDVQRSCVERWESASRSASDPSSNAMALADEVAEIGGVVTALTEVVAQEATNLRRELEQIGF